MAVTRLQWVSLPLEPRRLSAPQGHRLTLAGRGPTGPIDTTTATALAAEIAERELADTALEQALAGKAAASHDHNGVYDPAGTAAALTAAEAEAREAADAGLEQALDGKAPTGHGHSVGDVTGLQTALDGKQAALGYTPENSANRNAANGYAGLDGSGKVPSTLLPAYVDDVLESDNFASLPVTGETGKIYVTLDDNKSWRWGGSAYAEISASPGSTDAVAEGVTNLYFTAARVRAALLTGLAAGANAAIAATDTLLTALANLQAQIAAKQNALGYTAENAANRAAANGYAPLGADSRLPVANAPLINMPLPYLLQPFSTLKGAANVNATGAAALMVVGRLYFARLVLSAPMMLSELGLRVSTAGAAGTKARLGIYHAQADGLPGALLVDAGEVPTDSIAYVSVTINETLAAGTVYWLVAIFDGTPTVAGFNNHASQGPFLGFDAASTSNIGRVGFYRVRTYGALDASEAGNSASYTATAVAMPLVYFDVP